MNDHPPAPSTAPPPGSSPDRSDASVVTQFFLLPLLVVAGLVGVFLLFTLATQSAPTPEEHLKTLRSGRFNQRWQAAFELSNLLKTQEGGGDPGFATKLVKVFEDSLANEKEDPRVRRYLALALGDSGWEGAAPVLIRAAASADPETRLYALWSLGQLQAAESAPILLEALQDKDPAVRSVAAFGLGRRAAGIGLEKVKPLLEDPVPEVRWNAALALARMGDPSGEPMLIQMLDRKYLDEFSGLDAAEKSDLILNAMRGLKVLKTLGLDETIKKLAREDPDPTVRRAAGSWGEAGGS